jgi:hypothetical protein
VQQAFDFATLSNKAGAAADALATGRQAMHSLGPAHVDTWARTRLAATTVRALSDQLAEWIHRARRGISSIPFGDVNVVRPLVRLPQDLQERCLAAALARPCSRCWQPLTPMLVLACHMPAPMHHVLSAFLGVISKRQVTNSITSALSQKLLKFVPPSPPPRPPPSPRREVSKPFGDNGPGPKGPPGDGQLPQRLPKGPSDGGGPGGFRSSAEPGAEAGGAAGMGVYGGGVYGGASGAGGTSGVYGGSGAQVLYHFSSRGLCVIYHDK